MQATAFVNLTTHKLSGSVSGGGFTLPELVQGDEIKMSLRLIQQIEGVNTEVERRINSIRASIGVVDARPLGGQFKLAIDGQVVPLALSHSATASEVKDCLESFYDSAIEVTSVDGSWLIDIEDQTEAQLEITGESLSLTPRSHVRVRSYLVGNNIRHELRLIQSPLASTSTFSTIVPKPPSITRIQSGGNDNATEWPEIQALKINPGFRGSYQIRRGFKKSAELSVEDGAEEIAAALMSIADADGGFSVTNPSNNIAHITFEGSMGGLEQELLEIKVFSAPAGDPTFTLDLNTAEVANALRSSPTIPNAVLEVEIALADEDDPLVAQTVTPLRTPVKIIRELNWNGIEAAANIDWLRPPHGRTYIPFTQDQIITGSQHYVSPVGDGDSTDFTISHNLGTKNLHITLRKNNTEGAIVDRQFTLDGDDLHVSYAVTLDSDNDLSIKFDSPPANNAYVATISTAGPKSAFQDHTHTIAQVEGLDLILDDLGTRVNLIEDLLPEYSGISVANKDSGNVASWKLPDISEIFPTRTKFDTLDISKIVASSLPRSGGLLPAKYLTGSLTIANTIPTSPSLNSVYSYTDTSSPLIMPGYLGRKGHGIKAPAYYAWDGRGFYQVEKIIDTEDVYYPSDFSRELFRIHVNEKQLRVGKVFGVDFNFTAAVFNSNVSVNWGVVVDIGIPQSMPSNPSNISDVIYLPPSLDYSMMLTSIPSIHTFGLRVSRKIEDLQSKFFIDRILYGATEATGTVLSTANFVVRGRLTRFDTDNNELDPRGLIAFSGLASGTATELNDGFKIGTAKI